jgi:DNA-binding NarL/FixJ family response regulator
MEISNPNGKVPERPVSPPPKIQLRTSWIAKGMATPEQTRIYPGQKRKHKMKTRTKPMPAKNSLGSLGLTARETEVLTWVAQGKTNHEIGVILSACTRTICKHVEHILRKLCVENRTAAAAIALTALANAQNMSDLVR